MNIDVKKIAKPRSHYTLVKNSIIKIGGFCYHNNLFHYFDLHSPFGRDENNYVIGHGVSEDSIVTKNIRDAVYPTLVEDKDGVEDSSCIVVNDKIHLFYLANIYCVHDPKDINIHELSSIKETNLLVCFSDDDYYFNNRNNKKVLLRQKDFDQANLEVGSIEALTAYYYNGNYYVSVVGLEKNTNIRTIVSYCFDNVSYTMKYVGKCEFLENKYRVTSLSIKPVFELHNECMIITCSVCKDNRSGAYSITQDLGQYSRSYSVLANFDENTANFSYMLETKSRFDCSEDITSIKVNLDPKQRIMALGALPADYEIKDARGMFTSPRRITFEQSGKFSFAIHPTLDMKICNETSVMKIKQTHYPLKIVFSIRPRESISIGGLDIYTNENQLFVDRKKCIDNSAHYIRRKNYVFETHGKTVQVQCFIDHDICELTLNNSTFVTLSVSNLSSFIKTENVNIRMFSLNQVKE